MGTLLKYSDIFALIATTIIFLQTKSDKQATKTVKTITTILYVSYILVILAKLVFTKQI